MKVFLSWSSEKSLEVAKVFREWIPCINPKIVPYISAEDIDKGTRWSSDIAKELEESDFGILCVTKENVDSKWLNFEAGALSKTIDKARVCPFLFDLGPSDISDSPILQFQMTNRKKDDIYKLFHSINECMGEDKLGEEQLKKIFNLAWAHIDEGFKAIEKVPEVTKSGRKSENQQVLEEMLELLRSQQLLLKNPLQMFPVEYVDLIAKKVAEVSSEQFNRQVPTKAIYDYERSEEQLILFLSKIKENRMVEEIVDVIELNELVMRYMRSCKRILKYSGVHLPEFALYHNKDLRG